MRIKKIVSGFLAVTFLLSGNSAVQADKIGSFANVRNYIVRVLTSRMTNSEVLSYTSRKEEHFKKILEFCYYCRTQLLNFPKVELRWAITDVIKNDISSTWYDALITMRTDDPMIQYEHKMFVNVNSFDEVLYNFGIMYLVYKELTEQLEEGYPLCEDPKCFGRAINLGMIDQEASDERVRRLLRGLVCYFECMKDCQRSKFKVPLRPRGASPLREQEPSTDFVPIFMVMSPEDIAEVCTLKRPASAPCIVKECEEAVPASEPCSVKKCEEAGEKQLKEDEKQLEEDEKQLDDGMCVKQIIPIIPIIPSESPFSLSSIFGTEHCEEESVEQLEEDVEQFIPDVEPSEGMYDAEHCDEESVVQLGEDVDPLNGMYVEQFIPDVKPSEDTHDAEGCDEESVVQLEEKDEKNRGRMGTDTTHDIPIRAKSAPCAANSFARQGQEKEEGNVRGMPICPQSGLPNSGYPGDDSMSDSTELQLRMEKGKRQPPGRSATVHDGQTYSQGSGDFTKPLVFGITSEKKDDK